eukprot:768672-Hanusia_phi.AAC.11
MLSTPNNSRSVEFSPAMSELSDMVDRRKRHRRLVHDHQVRVERGDGEAAAGPRQAGHAHVVEGEEEESLTSEGRKPDSQQMSVRPQVLQICWHSRAGQEELSRQADVLTSLTSIARRKGSERRNGRGSATWAHDPSSSSLLICISTVSPSLPARGSLGRTAASSSRSGVNELGSRWEEREGHWEEDGKHSMIASPTRLQSSKEPEGPERAGRRKPSSWMLSWPCDQIPGPASPPRRELLGDGHVVVREPEAEGAAGGKGEGGSEVDENVGQTARHRLLERDTRVGEAGGEEVKRRNRRVRVHVIPAAASGQLVDSSGPAHERVPDVCDRESDLGARGDLAALDSCHLELTRLPAVHEDAGQHKAADVHGWREGDDEGRGVPEGVAGGEEESDAAVIPDEARRVLGPGVTQAPGREGGSGDRVVGVDDAVGGVERADLNVSCPSCRRPIDQQPVDSDGDGAGERRAP